MRFEFETIEAGRIVAGGDHHPAHRLPRFHRIRYRRGGRRFRREHHLVAVTGKHLGRASGELVGKETPVKTNDDARRIARHGESAPVIRRRLRHARHVGKSEIFRDDGPPAVRPKFDCAHRKRFFLGPTGIVPDGNRVVEPHLATGGHGCTHAATVAANTELSSHSSPCRPQPAPPLWASSGDCFIRP